MFDQTVWKISKFLKVSQKKKKSVLHQVSEESFGNVQEDMEEVW